jgi:hypothetical protein
MSTDSSPTIEIDLDADWDDLTTVYERPPLPTDLPPEMRDTPLVPPGQRPTVCPLCQGCGTVSEAAAAAFHIPQSRIPRL